MNSSNEQKNSSNEKKIFLMKMTKNSQNEQKIVKMRKNS